MPSANNGIGFSEFRSKLNAAKFWGMGQKSHSNRICSIPNEINL